METQKFNIVEKKIMDDIAVFEALFEEHWEEIAKNKQVMVLKPDYERYKYIEETGTMKTLVAYEGDTIVGYSVNFISKHIHYSDLSVCYNDIVFVTSNKRNSPVGLRLVKATEEKCKEWGAHMMMWHVKQNSSLDKILPRKGYNVQDIVYSKIV